jgi:PilZ domain
MERRSHPRQPVDRPAKIYGVGDEPLPCRVRDISDGGAKLHVCCKVARLPNTFDIVDILSGTRRTVRVVWVGLSGVGVRFADEAQSPPLMPKPTVFGRRHP